MNVLGFVRQPDAACTIVCEGDGLFSVKVSQDVTLEGAFDTGLKIYPPLATLPLVLPSEAVSRRGIRVEGLHRHDEVLTVNVTSPGREGTHFAAGETLAVLALVKVS